MRWNRTEIDRLSPILEQISADIAPVDGKRILVLCSAAGEMAFRLAEMMETGKVTGLELDEENLGIARRAAHEMGLEGMVEFTPAEKDHIPAPDSSFDVLVSEFIVYPSTAPTEIGQAEMARVLVDGGKMVLTDVAVTRPLPAVVREALTSIGLDYLCEASKDDFRSWMVDAGLINVHVSDVTSILREAWESRRDTDRSAAHQQGYSLLLDHGEYSLGKSIFYLYVSGEKPQPIPASRIRLV